MAFNTLISSGCSISLYVFVFKKNHYIKILNWMPCTH